MGRYGSGFGIFSSSTGGSSAVQSVTGLNTDNTDPINPIVKISVDGVTVTGLGTPASPLQAAFTSQDLASVLAVGNTAGTNNILLGLNQLQLVGDSIYQDGVLNILGATGGIYFEDETGASMEFSAGFGLDIIGASQLWLDTRTADGTLNFPSANGTVFDGTLGSLALTGNRTWRLPDASGTVALTADNIFTPTINGVTMKEVSVESDFGTPVGGVITLVANTTYFVRGNVAITNELLVNTRNAIIGFNRDIDKLTYSGSTNLITVVDNDFSMRNIGLCSTNATGKLLDATNITVAAPNFYGRTKVLELQNLKVEDTTNVFTIRGFELVDISNCLFWYISDGTIGCQFQSNRHLEISSCEFYNWFNRATPSNLDFYRQIEILANSPVAAGNGVININSSICHPETIQEGLYVNASSTTGFGTISSNTFTDTNLTTGFVIVLDYDVQNTYIIQANQGITNGNAFASMDITGNLVYLNNSTTNPIVLADANTVGGGGFTSPIAFPFSQRTINVVADGSIEYNRTLTSNFIVIVTATVQQSGNGVITARLRNNGTAITSSVGTTEIRSGIADTLSFSVLGQAVLGNVFDIEIESSGGSDVLVSNLTLNGYNF